MGKKDKKKGRGIEKTALKTEKKLTARQKKHLAEIGEEDIEKILAQIEQEEKKKTEIKEIIIDKPARRANFTLVPHPLKDEILLFGGEFFNGRKTVVYNDLISYNISKNTWTVIQTPNSPPPRCGHQMISLPKAKGQLWLFGGEFTGCTQNQFYHYKDLWLFYLDEKRWEKITSFGGPSARSGHRMVQLKNQIIIFGGYHDNLRDYRYFNDVYIFDLDTYKWSKLEPSGTPPAPRSGCQMVPLTDGKILIRGGYSKEKLKKDVDKGIIHTDMFLLSLEKNDTTGTKWKWVSVKQGGLTPSPRSGSSIVVAPGNKAYTFGGVFDVEESEEDICGTFFNDLNVLDLERRMWRPITLCGKKDSNQIKKRRRKDKSEEGDEENKDEPLPNKTTKIEMKTIMDGVFTLKVGPSNYDESTDSTEIRNDKHKLFSPSPRMNCGLVVKNGILYLYGGLIEDDDKQFTLADMYSLDLQKLDEWNIILKDEDACKEWISSESESEEEENVSEKEMESNDEEETKSE